MPVSVRGSPPDIARGQDAHRLAGCAGMGDRIGGHSSDRDRRIGMVDQALRLHDGPSDDLCVINPLSNTAFKGNLDDGINWHCPACGSLIAEAVYPGQLLDLVFRCHSCKQLGASPVRTSGQPIPGRPIVLTRGEYYYKWPVDVRKPIAIVGYQARESYLDETAARPLPFESANGGQAELTAALLREVASRAVKLLGAEYPRLRASNRKSAESQTPKRATPRLMELISYAEEVAKLIEERGPNGVVDGTKVSELWGTIEMFDRWRNHPAWPHLVKALATEAEGPHSLMLLTAASYLSDTVSGVGIVFGKAAGRIPDLWIEPDLTQRVNIEIKTPLAFRGLSHRSLSTVDAEAVITRQINRAASSKRGQFRGESGILAIGAFHLPARGLDQLVLATRSALEKQARARHKQNLVGILLSEFGFDVRGFDGRPAVWPRLGNRFVPHPGYRGSVRITEGAPRWLSQSPP
jgi:hypothetical protein